MTGSEYIKFHEEFVAEMTEIAKAKNADYTGGGDAFANFSLAESFGVTTTEQGMFIRMTDKMSRIASYTKKGQLQVKDESVTDTLMDLANYCILMSGYLKSKKESESDEKYTRRSALISYQDAVAYQTPTFEQFDIPEEAFGLTDV